MTDEENRRVRLCTMAVAEPATASRRQLHASSLRELAGLEAFLAEHRATLRRTEWHGGLFATRRAVGHGFHPFARHDGAGRTSGPLCLARLTALGLVLEVLVGEELLFPRRPDEFCAAINAREDP